MICRTNQWTGLYMIVTCVMKELKNSLPQLIFKINFNDCVSGAATQQAFTCSKPAIEGVK